MSKSVKEVATVIAARTPVKGKTVAKGKKPVKSVKRAKTARVGRAPKTYGFKPEQVITWKTGEENPIRKGTDKYKRWELVRRHSGKTVQVFMKNKGNLLSLNNAKAKKLVKVA